MDLQLEMGKYDENQYRILPMYKCNYLDNAETAIKSRFIYEISQGGNMGNAWDTAKDGIMSEEDYPYEHKVLANHTSP